MRKAVGADPDKRTPDERFRDEALPNLPAVTRYALSLTRDESDADDLVQETFLRAFRSWHQFEPGSECRAWLFTICRNTFLRSAHRAQRVVAHSDADLEAFASGAQDDSVRPDDLRDLLSSLDVIPAIRAAVDELPDPFRDAVVLVDLEDQSYDEAARVLDVPKGTVRSRLFRGRRLLQQRLVAFASDAGIAGIGDSGIGDAEDDL